MTDQDLTEVSETLVEPVYLEAGSERNKRLYLRHGFEVTGEIHLRDSPPMWCMWRPAS